MSLHLDANRKFYICAIDLVYPNKWTESLICLRMAIHLAIPIYSIIMYLHL